MMYSSNHNARSGFVLIEVLVTIAIVGMVIAPIFMLQSNMLRALYRVSTQARLLFPVKNALEKTLVGVSTQTEREVSRQEEIKNPAGTLRYTVRKIGDASALKNVKDMYFNEVQVRSIRGERESMVGFVYKPERKQQ